MQNTIRTSALAALMLSACQYSPEPTGFETLRDASWSQTASLTPEALTDRLGTFEEGKWTLRLAGAPTCAVDVFHYEYDTVGGRGEPVTASSALMVPRGDDEQCHNPNPIIVGLHGTMPDKPYNLADFSGTNPAFVRAAAWAGVYASQGYIVVAPNYTGLDTSNADYQSYHQADQKTEDIMGALAAARELLPEVEAQANDELFIVGYSQGGWLTMALQKELEARGMPITASVPMSGAYALSALVDNIFKGAPVRGSTIYFPMAIRAYQEGYGDVYADPAEVYRADIAGTVATLFPSETPHYEFIADGKLPASNLFNDSPDLSEKNVSEFVDNVMRNASPATDFDKFSAIYETGFGPDYLINDEFRIKYLQDIEANPDGSFPEHTTGLAPAQSALGLRRALIKNDLRNWTPQNPLMMCAGPGDGAVDFRFGAEAMVKYWSNPAHAPAPGVVSYLNFEAPIEAGEQFERLKRSFLAERDQIESAQKMPVWVDPYHQIVLPRYCYLAAREYFDALRE
jgi:dienelactone hydrolase